MDNLFSGQLAVVTGATRGIGWAIADQLRNHGAEVIATGTKPGGKVPDGCEYYAVNFLSETELQKFLGYLRTRDPSILINNAGINHIGKFEALSLKDFQEVQQVNVIAPFLICQSVISSMKSKAWGRIVNINSIWGSISKEYRAAYSASKFALDGMTISLAAEMGGFGILANSVSPGFIDTDLTRHILGEKEIENISFHVPLHRLGSPEEIAKFVVWLASPINTFINGQNIVIDGGFTRVGSF